jgi:hypothetical protein
VPHSIGRLLYLCNNKSDLETEAAIFEMFLGESKMRLETEIDLMQQKISTHDELKNLGAMDVPNAAGMPHF